MAARHRRRAFFIFIHIFHLYICEYIGGIAKAAATDAAMHGTAGAAVQGARVRHRAARRALLQGAAARDWLMGSPPCPHLRRVRLRAHPHAHICAGSDSGLTPTPTSAPGPDGLTPAHVCLGTAWAHPAHICAGTDATPAAGDHLRRGPQRAARRRNSGKSRRARVPLMSA